MDASQTVQSRITRKGWEGLTATQKRHALSAWFRDCRHLPDNMRLNEKFRPYNSIVPLLDADGPDLSLFHDKICDAIDSGERLADLARIGLMAVRLYVLWARENWEEEEWL